MNKCPDVLWWVLVLCFFGAVFYFSISDSLKRRREAEREMFSNGRYYEFKGHSEVKANQHYGRIWKSDHDGDYWLDVGPTSSPEIIRSAMADCYLCHRYGVYRPDGGPDYTYGLEKLVWYPD